MRRTNLIVLILALATNLHGIGSLRIVHEKVQGPAKWPTLDGERPSLAAHRGEKIYMPEHTEGSYELAAIEGADFVEPDLVLTKDMQLVCFHDLVLKGTTDVASIPEFANRTRRNFSEVIDEGGPEIKILEDWFIIDFTLEELQTLKVSQAKRGVRPQLFNGMFKIPTFSEYMETVHHTAWKLKKPIGIIPELKHPWWHNNHFNDTPRFMENLFLDTAKEWGYDSSRTNPCVSPKDGNETVHCSHLVIQSFDLSCIEYMKTRLNDLPDGTELMMLISAELPNHAPYLTFEGLRNVSKHAHYLASHKELLYVGVEKKLEVDGTEYDKKLIEDLGGFVPPRDIPMEAHALGMKVGIYTIYDSREPSNRGCYVKCDPENKELELFYYFDLGVDSFFVENVPEARELRLKYEYEWVGKETGAAGTLSISRKLIILVGLILISLQ